MRRPGQDPGGRDERSGAALPQDPEIPSFWACCVPCIHEMLSLALRVKYLTERLESVF